MMLLSKYLRIGVITLLSIVTVGCATVDPSGAPTPSEEPEAAQSSAETGAQEGQEASQAGAPKSSLPMVEDPMKTDLPLELIKAYDVAKNFLAAKNTQGALAKLQQTQEAFPQESGPSYRIARIHLEAKEYDKALQAVEKSVFVNPKNYYAQNLKGVILRELGKFPEAKTAYMAALEAYPRHADSHLNLGILADIYMYDLPLALKHYEFYLELIQAENKKVNGWVIDLKRRIPQGG